MIGRRTGKHRITALIGRGTCGTVYSALDEKTGREVALKVLYPELVSLPGLVERIKKTCQSLQGVECPSLLQPEEIIETEEGVMVLMEKVAGKSLAVLSEELGTPLLPEQAHPLFMEVLGAADCVHEAGLFCGNIRPSNILICATEKGSLVRLTDVSIFPLSDQGGPASISEPLLLEYLRFQAPEVIAERSPLTRAADVFALGATLHQMVTGWPLRVALDLKRLKSVAQKASPDPRTLLPNLPSELAVALCTATAMDPKTRFQSVRAFIEALSPLKKEKPSSGQPRSQPLSREERRISGSAATQPLYMAGRKDDSNTGEPADPLMDLRNKLKGEPFSRVVFEQVVSAEGSDQCRLIRGAEPEKPEAPKPAAAPKHAAEEASSSSKTEARDAPSPVQPPAEPVQKEEQIHPAWSLTLKMAGIVLAAAVGALLVLWLIPPRRRAPSTAKEHVVTLEKKDGAVDARNAPLGSSSAPQSSMQDATPQGPHLGSKGPDASILPGKGKIKISSLSVKGDPESAGKIREVLNRSIPPIQKCYLELLLSRPEAKGDVDLSFVLQKNGRVERAVLLKSGLRHDATSSCFLAVIKSMQMPLLSAATTVTISISVSP